MPRLIQYHNSISPASFSVMRLVLFRHAERANTGSHNPPLSAHGERQSRELKTLVIERQIDQPQILLSSPKLRAQQTFLTIASHLKMEIQTWDDLDERSSSENTQLFSKRVHRTIEALTQLSGTVFVCTHVDWIEEALADIDPNQNRYMSWSTGQYVQFEINNGIWQVSKEGRLS